MVGWEWLFCEQVYEVISRAYVDDVKVAGRKAGLQKGWGAIRGPGGLTLDEPIDFGPYLCCEQVRGGIAAKDAN